MTGHQEARYSKVTQAAMLAQTAVAAEIAMLMIRYSFDLGNYSPEQWINQWLQQYPDLWLHEAVVEALYQGRYKAVSVWQILDLWQRRGKPLRHFNREFERMVAGHRLPLLFTPDAVLSPNYAAENNASDSSDALTDHRPAAASLILPPSPLGGFQSRIQPYKPSSQFHLALPEKMTLPQSYIRVANQPPIQQFVPTPETSELHSKLKSIAQALILNNAQMLSMTLAARPTQLSSVATEPDNPDNIEPGNDNLDNAESVSKPDLEPETPDSDSSEPQF
jgi:hypothetical protein